MSRKIETPEACGAYFQKKSLRGSLLEKETDFYTF